MAGLLNRRRGFLDESGAPVVLGLHAVGDAHTCTNPLYGRGCSLALVQAELFADSLKEHGLNHRDRAVAFEGATRDEITPWYRASVAQDRLSADSTAAVNGTAAAADNTADAATSTAGAREFMRDGLLPAMRTDPVVVRAFLRMFNLLEAPNSLMTNSDVVARVLTVFNDREHRPAELSMGPDRVSLLGVLS
jgi:flavin-dependent dehydrogenase